MRILQIANFVSPKSGGLRTAIDALREGYEQLGWTVHRLTPFPEDQRKNEISGIRSARVPTMGSYRVILGRRQVQKVILELRPDIVELSDKSTMAWIPRWCKARGIPCCVISHERMDLTLQNGGVMALPVRAIAQHWRKQIAQHSSHVVCASLFAAHEFANLGARSRIIPLGVNSPAIKAGVVIALQPRRSRIVMCCRLSEEKNPEVVVEAIRLLSQHRDIELVVLGDGPMRTQLETRATGLKVSFLGHVADRGAVLHELSTADVVVNVGTIETFGLVTLEALASGTPVVVANTGASPELINDECGRVVEVTPESVANGINDILESYLPETRERCRARAQQFPWSRTVSEFAHLYTELVGGVRNVA